MHPVPVALVLHASLRNPQIRNRHVRLTAGPDDTSPLRTANGFARGCRQYGYRCPRPNRPKIPRSGGEGTGVAAASDTLGLRFANELGASQFPWKTMTAVFSNAKITVFMRDRAVLGYIPARAFESDADRQRMIDFATSRVQRSRADANSP